MPWSNLKKISYQREYRKKHREHYNALRRRRYLENPDAERDYTRKWRSLNPDKVAEQCIRANAARRAAYPERREMIQSRLRKYRAENPDLVRKYNQKAYGKHRDKILLYIKRYQKENPHVASQTAHKRRAVIMCAAIGDVSEIAEWMKLVKSKRDFICQYCKREFPISKLNFDHVVPLARGGEHSKENLCTSCNKCNQSKGKKLLCEWESPE